MKSCANSSSTSAVTLSPSVAASSVTYTFPCKSTALSSSTLELFFPAASTFVGIANVNAETAIVKLSATARTLDFVLIFYFSLLLKKHLTISSKTPNITRGTTLFYSPIITPYFFFVNNEMLLKRTFVEFVYFGPFGNYHF